jgi:hypothetical protein
MTQIETAPAVTFTPLRLTADGAPQYKFGKQLRKSVLVNGDPVAEVRWTKGKGGWQWALVTGGRKMAEGFPTAKRDQRCPSLLTAARALAAPAPAAE